MAVVIIVVVALIANQLGLFDLLKGGSLKERVERLDGMFQSLGAWAPVVFVLIWILSCTLLLPGLPITIAGALVFGAVWGSVYTAIGANIGACAAFLVGRYAARSMVEGWIEKNKSLKKIDEGVRQQGWRMLMITRFVPLFPFSLQNYVYGLTNIPFRTYASGYDSHHPSGDHRLQFRGRFGAGGHSLGGATRGPEENGPLSRRRRRVLRHRFPDCRKGEETLRSRCRRGQPEPGGPKRVLELILK